MATRRPVVPRTAGAKRPAPPKAEPAKAEPARAEPAKARTTGAGASKLGTAKPGTAKPGATEARGSRKGTVPAGVAKASTAAARAAGRDRAASDAETAPVPARAFSGRILALAVVLIAITVMLAPTVRVFLSQRAEISALEQDIAARKAEQDGLRQSISRWEDPNYVKQQARDRINMVMPGETSYWVFGDVGPASGSGSGSASQAGGDRPWAEGFWESFVRAATE
jgi:cell division protein FtsB